MGSTLFARKHYKRFAHEIADNGRDVWRRDRWPASNLRGCVNRKRAVEDREAFEDSPLIGIEKLEAPFKDRLQRLVTWKRRSKTIVKQEESVVETGGHAIHTEGRHAASGKSNRERIPSSRRQISTTGAVNASVKKTVQERPEFARQTIEPPEIQAPSLRRFPHFQTDSSGHPIDKRIRRPPLKAHER